MTDRSHEGAAVALAAAARTAGFDRVEVRSDGSVSVTHAGKVRIKIISRDGSIRLGVSEVEQPASWIRGALTRETFRGQWFHFVELSHGDLQVASSIYESLRARHEG